MTPSYLPIALRVYTARRAQADDQIPERSACGPRVPDLILTFDAETSVDPAQRLLLGTARVSRVIVTGNLVKTQLVRETLFYADDLPERDPQAFAVLRHHARRCKHLCFMSQKQFLDRVLWRLGYQARAGVVGLNEPFDISRLAYRVGQTRLRKNQGDPHRTHGMVGAFSFVLWRYRRKKDGVWRDSMYRPRSTVKTVDRSRALKGFSRPFEIDPWDQIPEGSSDGLPDPTYSYHGNLIDLHQLGFGMDNERYSLAQACQVYGVEHGKLQVSSHGTVTPQYIEYARRDTLATEELFCKMMAEYLKHPIDLPPSHVFSPASIAKAYLRAMGIRPLLERQPNFPRRVLGIAMSAFYGGRAECRIRRTTIPVTHMDYTSMYPTVFTLLGLWDLLVCDCIDVVGATRRVRELLSRADLQRYCMTPAAWREMGCSFVQVLPDEEIFPVRARYGDGASWNIGVNPLTSRESLWFSLPDVVAAAILTGRAPRILRAIRLVLHGISDTPQPTRFRGSVPIDPRRDNFFKVAIEERKRSKNRRDLPQQERDRLDLALKIVANAGAYGIFAEFIRQELPKGLMENVLLYGHDGPPLRVAVNAPEEPGEFAFPPIAAVVTGAARLKLALLERLVTGAGGYYAFCDTDSMAVVSTETGGLVPCPGGPLRLPDGRPAIRALSWAEVERIRLQFAPLNPYDPRAVPGPILRLEDKNFDLDGKTRHQLFAYVISAKRYALFNVHGARAVLRDWSEHGLGLYMNPIEPDSPDREWIRALWKIIVAQDGLGQATAMPGWLTSPAISRFTVSSPALLKPFAALNKGKPYPDQIKPFNFLLSAHVRPLGYPPGCDPQHFHLIAPWEPDPRKWLSLQWIDQYSGKTFRITVGGITGSEGVARVKTMADAFAEYRLHPEPKSLGPDGASCNEQTVGLLHRRHVVAIHVRYVGKESNYLEERELGLVHDLDEVLTEYADPRRDPFDLLVRPVLRDRPAREITKRVRTKIATAGGRTIRQARRAALTKLAAEIARKSLRTWGVPQPDTVLACCYVYLDERERRGVRTCQVCAKPLRNLPARYCSAACKHRAFRRRKRGAVARVR